MEKRVIVIFIWVFKRLKGILWIIMNIVYNFKDVGDMVLFFVERNLYRIWDKVGIWKGLYLWKRGFIS